MNLTRFISDILHLPPRAMIYEASRRLHDMFSDQFILETEDYDFKLKQYAAAGKCIVHTLDEGFGHFDAEWLGRTQGIGFEPKNGVFEILWRGKRLRCITLSDGCNGRHFIIGDHRRDVMDFFAAACSLEVDANDEILVFQNGYWRRDQQLKKQIADAKLDDVVLPEAVKSDLLRDTETFFASKELYERHGVAWKRGLLLLGKPGNGKTLTIKSLVNRLGIPCLYVRNFSAENSSVDWCIAYVFRKAREVAPCMLVMEDLDSLVEEENLSALLNELDGFEANRGILTVATTNYPERLDPALLNRPSRFDRKIEFPDPAFEERHRFLQAANEKRDTHLRVPESVLMAAAEETEGFSFAFLKELNVCALTKTVIEGVEAGEALLLAIEALKSQIGLAPRPAAKKKPAIRRRPRRKLEV